MRFKYREEIISFDQTVMSVAEARTIKKFTGFGLKPFSEGLQNGDPDSIVAMLYLAYRRSGRAVQWNDFDEWNLNEIEALTDEVPAIVDAPDEGGEGGDPNPVAVAAVESGTPRSD